MPVGDIQMVDDEDDDDALLDKVPIIGVGLGSAVTKLRKSR